MGPPTNEERVYGYIDLFKQVGDARPTQIYSLRTKEIKIGREHKCDIRIHNLRISRLQCCVNIAGPEDNQKVRLRNLTSKTTTYYNNRNINLDEQVELKDGDRFRLYDTELRFRDFKPNDPPPEAMSGKPVPVIRLVAKEKAGNHSSTPNKIPSLLKTPKSDKIKSSSPSRSSERMNKTMGSSPNGGRVEMDRTPKRRRSSDVELRKAVLQRRFRKSVQGKAFPAEISEGPEAEDDEEEDEDEQEDEEEGSAAEADQDSAKSAATNDTLLSDSITESLPETNQQASYIVPEDESVDLLAPVVVDPPAVSPKNQSQDMINFADIEREMFQLHEEGDKTNNNNNAQDTSSNAETSESTSKTASTESDQPIQADVVANGIDAEDTELLDSNGVVVDISTGMDTQVINDFPGIIDDSFSSRWNDSATTFGRSFHTAADNDEQDLSFEPMEVDEEPLNDQTGTTNADGSFYDACADQNVTDDMFSVIEAEDIPADPSTSVIQQSVEVPASEVSKDSVKDAEVNGNSASSSCEPDTQETVATSASQESCFESVSIEQIEEELADMFEPDEEEGTGRETIPETQNEIRDDDTAKKDDEDAEKGVDDTEKVDDDTKKRDDDVEKADDGTKKGDDDAEKADVEPINSSDSSSTPEQEEEIEASDPDVENRNVTVTSPVVENQDDSLGLGAIFSESAVEIVEVTETAESAENKETEGTETNTDDVVVESSSVSVSDDESDEESPAVIATVEITEMDTQVIVEENETPVPEDLELQTEVEFSAEPVALADKTVDEMDSLCFPDTPRQSVDLATTSLMPDVEEIEVVEEPAEAGATSPTDSVPAPEESRPSASPAISSSEKQSAETPEVAAVTSDDEVTAIDVPSGSKRTSVVTRRVSRSTTASKHIVTLSDSDEEQTKTVEEPKEKTVKTSKSLFKKPTGTPVRTPAKTRRDTDEGDSSDDCVAIRSSALSTPRQTRSRQTNSDNDFGKRNAMTTPRARQSRTALRSKGSATPSQKDQAKSSDSSDVEVIESEPEMTNTSSLVSKNSEQPVVAEAEPDAQEVNDESVAGNDESVARIDESVARIDESVAINEESMAVNEEPVAINEESVAINEESVGEPAEISLPTADSDIEDDLQSLAGDAASSKKPLKALDMQRSKADIIMEDDEESADGLGDPDVSLDLEEGAPEEEDDAEEADQPDASAASDADDEEVEKPQEIKLREFSVVLKRLEMDFDKSSSEEEDEDESEDEVPVSKSEEIDFQDEEEGAVETLAEDRESGPNTSEREEEEVSVVRRRSKKSHLPITLSESEPNTSAVASTSRKSTGKSTSRHSSEADVEMVEMEEDAKSTSPEKQSSAHETSADMEPVPHHVDDVEMVEDEVQSQEEPITNSRLTGADDEEDESAEAHLKTPRRSASKVLKVSEAEDEETPSNASPRKSSRRSSLKSVDAGEASTTSRISRRSSKVAESEEARQEERSTSSSRTPRRTSSKVTKGKEEKESSPESSPIKRSTGSTSKIQADDNESEGNEVASPVASSSKKLSSSKISNEVSSSQPEASSPEHEGRSPSKSTEDSPREPRKNYNTKYGIKYDASIELRELKIILDRLEETEEGRRRQPKRRGRKGKESEKRDVEYVDLEDGSSDSEASEMSQPPVIRSARKSSSSTEVSQTGRSSHAKKSNSAEASDALEDDDGVETEPKVQEEVPSAETPKRHKSSSPARSSKKAVEPTAPVSSDENIAEDVQSQSDDLSDAETIPIKSTPRPRKPLLAAKTPKSTPRRGRSTNPDVIIVAQDEEIEKEDEDVQEVDEDIQDVDEDIQDVDEDIQEEDAEIEKEDDQPQKAHSSKSKRGRALAETPKKAEAKKGRARKVPSADESEESSGETKITDLDKHPEKMSKAKAEPPSRSRNLRKHTISEASTETVAIESKKKEEPKKLARAAKNTAAEVDEEALEALSSHGRNTRRNDVEVVKEIKSTRRGNKAKEPKDDEVFIEPEAPPSRSKRGQEKKAEEPKKSPNKRSGRTKIPPRDASEEPVSSKRTRHNDHTEEEEESDAESAEAVDTKVVVVTKSRQKQKTTTAPKIQEEDESDVEQAEERPKSRSDRSKKDTDDSSQERPALRIGRSKKQLKNVSPELPASRTRGRSRKDDTDESSQERPASRRGRPRKNPDESSSQERSDNSSSKVDERSTRRKPVDIVTIDEPVSMEGGRKQQKAKAGKKGQKDEEKSADKEPPKKPTPPAASSSSRLKPKPVVELTRVNVPTRSPRVTRAQSTDAEPAPAPAPVQLPKRKKRGATQDPEENPDEEPPSDTESVSSRTRGRGTKEPKEGTQSKGTRSKKIKEAPAKATKPSKRKPPVEEVEIVDVNDEEEEEEPPKEKTKPKRANTKSKAAKPQERVNEAEEKGNESDVVVDNEEPKTRSERRVKADSGKTKKPVAQVTNEEEEPKAKRLRRAEVQTAQVSKSSKATRAKPAEKKSEDEEEEEQQREKPQKASKSTKRTRRAAEVEEEPEVVIAAETKRDRRKQPAAMEPVAEEVPKPARRGKTTRQANAKAESSSRVVLQLPPDSNDDVIEISGDEEERPQSRAKRARTDKDQVKTPVTATRATRRRGK